MIGAEWKLAGERFADGPVEMVGRPDAAAVGDFAYGKRPWARRAAGSRALFQHDGGVFARLRRDRDGFEWFELLHFSRSKPVANAISGAGKEESDVAFAPLAAGVAESPACARVRAAATEKEDHAELESKFEPVHRRARILRFAHPM